MLSASAIGINRLIIDAPMPYGPTVCPGNAMLSLYPSSSNPRNSSASYKGFIQWIIKGLSAIKNIIPPVNPANTSGFIWSSVLPMFIIMFLYFFSSGFSLLMSVSPYPVGLFVSIFLTK